MSTGSFESWTGNIAEIGALYPFEGTEIFWVIGTVVFWLVWQFRQLRLEQKKFKREVEYLTPERLRKMVDGE